MQMGPMIDMVFLLLVFFMVSAKPITPESDIPIGLPGQVAQEEAGQERNPYCPHELSTLESWPMPEP